MTDKQRQYLLGYLGFYSGTVDGIWGRASKNALAAFRERAGADTDDALKKAVAQGLPQKDFWSGVRYFRRSEFRCPCPRCGGFPAEPLEALVTTADRIREILGAPATVSSGVRCPEHNREVGGVANSRHLTGRAMDFAVAGVDSGTLLQAVLQQPGIHYAYAIDRSFVHMDM